MIRNLHEMTPEPLISVIMPCFNNAATITRSVSSALDQSYRNIEIILVDDGSTDNSRETAFDLRDKDSRLKVVTQSNQGPGPARNRGLMEAHGEFVAFLDADDCWDTNCLARLHAALTRRSAIDDVGGFDEQWTSCMDYDLWLRMATTHTIERVPEVLAYYVHHAGEQITKNRLRGAVNHWRIQRRFVSEHPEVARKLGRNRIRKITYGELLRRAYICYWDRDLDTAHKLFRIIMKGGYGKVSDWKYLAPALLPMRWYRGLINRVDNAADDKR
jgi:glycosyltransferase involved in cell wall biosynthesis